MFKSFSKSSDKSSSTSSNASSEALLKSNGDKKQTSPAPSQPKNYEAAFGALQASYGLGSGPANSSK
jgi:hypothetical protein